MLTFSPLFCPCVSLSVRLFVCLIVCFSICLFAFFLGCHWLRSYNQFVIVFFCILHGWIKVPKNTYVRYYLGSITHTYTCIANSLQHCTVVHCTAIWICGTWSAIMGLMYIAIPNLKIPAIINIINILLISSDILLFHFLRLIFRAFVTPWKS